MYIYDGLPDDMLVDAPSFITEGRSLGSFCGQAQMEAPTVVAASGKLYNRGPITGVFLWSGSDGSTECSSCFR